MKRAKITGPLSSLDKELTDEILKFGVIRTFQTGDLIMETGQRVYSSFLIISGLIQIIKKTGGEKESFLYYLQPGQACAVTEIAIANGSILAVAAGETKVIAILYEFRDRVMFKHRNWYCFA